MSECDFIVLPRDLDVLMRHLASIEITQPLLVGGDSPAFERALAAELAHLGIEPS